VPGGRARGLVDLVGLMSDGDGEAKRRGVPIEKPGAKINGDTLSGELAAIVKAGNTVDVVSRKRAAQLNANVLGGNEFHLELFAGGTISPALSAKAPGRLALKFALSDIAGVGADHEGKQMLGIDTFGTNAIRKQHPETRKGRPDVRCADTCTDKHPDSAKPLGVKGKRQHR